MFSICLICLDGGRGEDIISTVNVIINCCSEGDAVRLFTRLDKPCLYGHSSCYAHIFGFLGDRFTSPVNAQLNEPAAGGELAGFWYFQLIDSSHLLYRAYITAVSGTDFDVFRAIGNSYFDVLIT